LPFANLWKHNKHGKVEGPKGIPEVCGQRWRATIFFDGRWQVGYNKLKLSVNDLGKQMEEAVYSKFTDATLAEYDEWVQNRDGLTGWAGLWKRKGSDQQMEKDMESWLDECHKQDEVRSSMCHWKFPYFLLIPRASSGYHFFEAADEPKRRREHRGCSRS
jgi:hypothetical protein